MLACTAMHTSFFVQFSTHTCTAYTYFAACIADFKPVQLTEMWFIDKQNTYKYEYIREGIAALENKWITKINWRGSCKCILRSREKERNGKK